MLTVALDPGHGGTDSGAQSREDEPNWIVEKRWVLRQCQDLALLASRARMPFRCVFTREEDEYVSLRQRNLRAKRHGSHLVLCIHANSAPDPKAHGLRTFHWPGNTLGLKVADQIVRSAPTPLEPSRLLPTSVTKDEWRRAYNVVGSFAATAVLVECGFLTNARDREALRTPDVRRGINLAILSGILSFLVAKQEAARQAVPP